MVLHLFRELRESSRNLLDAGLHRHDQVETQRSAGCAARTVAVRAKGNGLIGVLPPTSPRMLREPAFRAAC
ncbi:MAG: hypothetical protein ACREVE_16590 [Gammaproteobacteria bacterium]